VGWGAGVDRALLTGLVPLAVVLLGSGLAVVPAGPGPADPAGRVDPAVVEADAPPADRLRARTVLVRTTTCDGERTGTGVVLDGEVVTNAHVVAGAAGVELRFADGTWQDAAGVRTAPGLDIAVLAVGDPPIVDPAGGPLELRPGPLRPGTEVWTAGHPGGGPLVVARSRVLRRRDRQVWSDPRVAVELESVARPGQSGSPVLDTSGRLVGLVYASAFDGARALVVEAPELAEALDSVRSAVARADDGLVECPGGAGD